MSDNISSTRGRILLTGGAGYIGSHTYVALVEAGYDVVILDDFSNARRSVIQRLARVTARNDVRCIEGSVLDRALLDRVFSEEKFDAVIHFAARKAVGESTERPLDYIETNCAGLLNVLRAMEATGVRALVFSSTATVYGDPEILPIPETAPLGYTSPYAFTKLMGEQILGQAAQADPSWRFGILRYFNPVGAHASGLIGEDPDTIPNNLMPYLARVATGDLPELTVFGDDYDTPDGTGVRDYIHVEDLARGHLASLERLLEGGGGHIVNIGTGQGYSVLDIHRAYSKACGRDLPYRIGPRRPGDVATLLADPALARDLLGFTPRHDLDSMCDSSWRWTRTAADLAL